MIINMAYNKQEFLRRKRSWPTAVVQWPEIDGEANAYT